MVAALELKNDENQLEKTFVSKDLRTMASEKGHEEWRASTQRSGFSLGFPDNPIAKVRSGLVPFDIIVSLRKYLTNITDPSQIRNAMATNFIELLLNESENNRIVLKKEFENELKALVRGKNDIGFLSIEDVKNWIFELVNKWFSKNVTWADNAEEIIRLAQDEFGSLDNADSKEKIMNEIDEVRTNFRKLKASKSPSDIRKILEDKKTLELLVLIHGGWRTQHHELINHSKVITASFDNTIYKISYKKFEELFINTIKFSSPVELNSLKGQINTFKERVERSSGVTYEITFELMLQISDFIEEQKNITKNDKTKKVLEECLDYILDTIKYDANTALLESVIQYISKRP